eukprot:COSAG01_NODE_21707_length_889_cov_0.741772_2_plen_191_part_00
MAAATQPHLAARPCTTGPRARRRRRRRRPGGTRVKQRVTVHHQPAPLQRQQPPGLTPPLHLVRGGGHQQPLVVLVATISGPPLLRHRPWALLLALALTSAPPARDRDAAPDQLFRPPQRRLMRTGYHNVAQMHSLAEAVGEPASAPLLRCLIRSCRRRRCCGSCLLLEDGARRPALDQRRDLCVDVEQLR